MTDVLLPKLGEMTEDAIVIEWLVEVGDRVLVGTPLAMVDTDKVEAEVPSPIGGTVTELRVKVDEEVAVGSPICTIEEEGT